MEEARLDPRAAPHASASAWIRRDAADAAAAAATCTPEFGRAERLPESADAEHERAFVPTRADLVALQEGFQIPHRCFLEVL